MTAAAVPFILYASVITLIGAFLFTAVDWLEPNHRLAMIFKCAILAAGGAAIASNCCRLSEGDLSDRREVRSRCAQRFSGASPARRAEAPHSQNSVRRAVRTATTTGSQARRK
jgi:hypothetical protein